MTISNSPRFRRIARSVVTSVVPAIALLLTWVANAHAHGGMAGPEEIGPPLFTGVALGFLSYWAVVLWPTSRRRKDDRRADPSDGDPIERPRRVSNNGATRSVRTTPRLRKIEGGAKPAGDSTGDRKAIDA